MRGNEVACASSLPARFELQEAEVWARCVELTAAVPGNPLGAVVGHEGSVPLAALTAAASGALNRVIALGVPSPSSKAAVDRVVEFFERVEQDCFQVELAPIAAPPALGDWLQGAGLLISPETVTKVWRDLEGFDLTVDDVDVRKLTARDADQVAGLNVRAWGAWQQPSLHSWFAATVGQDGFHHCGAFVDDRLVSCGALVIDNDLAWIGFDATHPRHKLLGLRRSLTVRRLADARAAGCRYAHAETRQGFAKSRESLFDTLYERRLFTHSSHDDTTR
ncbi:MAG: hypothetical protein ACLQU9_03400 [Acidimicrobiales bacterium]